MRLLGGYRSLMSVGRLPPRYTAVETLLTKSRTSTDLLPPPRLLSPVAMGFVMVPSVLPLWCPSGQQGSAVHMATCLTRYQPYAAGLGFSRWVFEAGDPNRWVMDPLAPLRFLDQPGAPRTIYVRAPSKHCSLTRALDLVDAWRAEEIDVPVWVCLDTAYAWGLGDPVWITLMGEGMAAVSETERTRLQRLVGLMHLDNTDALFREGFVGSPRPLTGQETGLGFPLRDAERLLSLLPNVPVLMERIRPADWERDADFIESIDKEAGRG